MDNGFQEEARELSKGASGELLRGRLVRLLKRHIASGDEVTPEQIESVIQDLDCANEDIPRTRVALLACLDDDTDYRRPGRADRQDEREEENTARLDESTGRKRRMASSHSFVPGTGVEIDGYRLVTLIGEGGMGEVWKAQESESEGETFLAIKFLAREFCDNEDAKKALTSEFRKIQKLDHPNIVKAVELQVGSELPYMVMEYVEGISLRRLIKNNPDGLSVKEAAPIVCQLARALSYAHKGNNSGKTGRSTGYIHSDLKPSNILYNEITAEVKIIDFGIAQHLDQEEREKTVLRGGINAVESFHALTEPYASYEMFQGYSPDPKDDVYSLCCVVYELLAGSHPYQRLGAPDAEKELKEARIELEKPSGITKKQWNILTQGLEMRRRNRLRNTDLLAKVFCNRGWVEGKKWWFFITVGIIVLSATITAWYFYENSRRSAHAERLLDASERCDIELLSDLLEGTSENWPGYVDETVLTEKLEKCVDEMPLSAVGFGNDDKRFAADISFLEICYGQGGKIRQTVESRLDAVLRKENDVRIREQFVRTFDSFQDSSVGNRVKQLSISINEAEIQEKRQALNICITQQRMERWEGCVEDYYSVYEVLRPSRKEGELYFIGALLEERWKNELKAATRNMAVEFKRKAAEIGSIVSQRYESVENSAGLLVEVLTEAETEGGLDPRAMVAGIRGDNEILIQNRYVLQYYVRSVGEFFERKPQFNRVYIEEWEQIGVVLDMLEASAKREDLERFGAEYQKVNTFFEEKAIGELKEYGCLRLDSPEVVFSVLARSGQARDSLLRECEQVVGEALDKGEIVPVRRILGHLKLAIVPLPERWNIFVDRLESIEASNAALEVLKTLSRESLEQIDEKGFSHIAVEVLPKISEFDSDEATSSILLILNEPVSEETLGKLFLLVESVWGSDQFEEVEKRKVRRNYDKLADDVMSELLAQLDEGLEENSTPKIQKSITGLAQLYNKMFSKDVVKATIDDILSNIDNEKTGTKKIVLAALSYGGVPKGLEGTVEKLRLEVKGFNESRNEISEMVVAFCNGNQTISNKKLKPEREIPEAHWEPLVRDAVMCSFEKPTFTEKDGAEIGEIGSAVNLVFEDAYSKVSKVMRNEVLKRVLLDLSNSETHSAKGPFGLPTVTRGEKIWQAINPTDENNAADSVYRDAVSDQITDLVNSWVSKGDVLKTVIGLDQLKDYLKISKKEIYWRVFEEATRNFASRVREGDGGKEGKAVLDDVEAIVKGLGKYLGSKTQEDPSLVRENLQALKKRLALQYAATSLELGKACKKEAAVEILTYGVALEPGKLVETALTKQLEKIEGLCNK